MKKALILVVLVSGYLIMSLEILGGRLLAPFFGNSVYVWGSLIGVILTALSGGYYLGGWLSEFYFNKGKKGSAGFFLDKLFLVAVVFLLIDLFSYSSILDWLSSWNLVWGALAAALIIFCVPMVSLAAVSPLVVRILSEQEKTGYSAGLVYTWGTAGSILGTFLTTFWLIPYFGSRLTLYSCFFIALLVLVVLLLKADRRQSLVAVFIFLISLIILRPPVLPKNVILETESAYNQIRLIDKDGKKLLTLNSQRDLVAQSGYSNSTGAGSDWSYLDNLFGIGPLIKPVNNLLVLGMAAGSTVSQHQKFSPWVKIDAVEIDPEIIKVAQNNFGIKEGENLKIFRADARPFLASSQKQYDMIEVDLFAGSPYIPFYVATQEFFEATARRLVGDGILMMNIFAPGHQEILPPVMETIASVYPSVYRISLRNNFIILAVRSSISLEEIKKRLSGQEKITPVDLGAAISYALEHLEAYKPEKKAPIFTDDWAPVEAITYKMLDGLKI